MKREEAMQEYRILIGRHGLEWTPRTVPDQVSWDKMEQINKLLTTEDRREALGLPNVRSSSAR